MPPFTGLASERIVLGFAAGPVLDAASLAAEVPAGQARVQQLFECAAQHEICEGNVPPVDGTSGVMAAGWAAVPAPAVGTFVLTGMAALFPPVASTAPCTGGSAASSAADSTLLCFVGTGCAPAPC